MLRLAAIAIARGIVVGASAAADGPLGQGMLVFASTRALNYGAPDLMTIDARGRRRNLTQSPGVVDDDADLSPDAKRIVFTRLWNEGVDLFTITPTGRGLQRVTRTPEASESAPVYSPSGDAIAFIREVTDPFLHTGGGRPLPGPGLASSAWRATTGSRTGTTPSS